MRPDILRQIIPTTILAAAMVVAGCGNPEAVEAQGTPPPNATPISGPVNPLPENNALAFDSAARPSSVNHLMLADITAVLSETRAITDTVVPIALTAPKDRVVTYPARVANNITNIRSTPSVSAVNVITTTVEGSVFAVDPSRKVASGGGFTWIPVITQVDGVDRKGWITTTYSSSTTMTETIPASSPSSSVSIVNLLSPFAQIGGGGEGNSTYPDAVQDFLDGIQTRQDESKLLALLGRAAQAEPDYVQQMMQALGSTVDYHIVATDPLQSNTIIEQGMGFPVGMTIQKGSLLTGYGAIAAGQDLLFLFNVNPPQNPTSDVQPDQYVVQLTRDQLVSMYGSTVADELITGFTQITGAHLLDQVLDGGVGVVEGKDNTQVTVPPLLQGDIGVNPDASVVYSQETDGFFGMVYNREGQLIAEYMFNPADQQWQQVEVTVSDLASESEYTQMTQDQLADIVSSSKRMYTIGSAGIIGAEIPLGIRMPSKEDPNASIVMYGILLDRPQSIHIDSKVLVQSGDQHISNPPYDLYIAPVLTEIGGKLRVIYTMIGVGGYDVGVIEYATGAHTENQTGRTYTTKEVVQALVPGTQYDFSPQTDRTDAEWQAVIESRPDKANRLSIYWDIDTSFYQPSLDFIDAATNDPNIPTPLGLVLAPVGTLGFNGILKQ